MLPGSKVQLFGVFILMFGSPPTLWAAGAVASEAREGQRPKQESCKESAAGNLKLRSEQFRAAKKIIVALSVAAIGVGSIVTTVSADSLQDGITAYKNRDNATALRLLLPLAQGGDAHAQTVLGYMYEDGKGVTQNYATALKWYRLAADQGYVEAEKELGMMYLVGGHGMPKSDAEGVKWLQKASAHGNAGAQWWLGSMYCNGEQVPKNNAEGMKWLRLAADQGATQAQVSLGARYADGDCGPQDYVLGYMWLNLAAGSGEEEAVRRRDIITQKMTPEQIAEAQKLSREWRPAK
jgi:hypothetical protein